MTFPTPLAGRAALVTGGSRGIGAAIAERLAREGADVAITYARSADRARAVADRVTGLGRRSLAIAADAADPAAVPAAVDRAAAAFGRLDILVSNAGVAAYGPLDEVSPQELDHVLAVHVRAVFTGVQAAARHLGDGGRVIGIGSNLAERVPYPGMALYAMSKAALVGLTKGAARDLGPRGITVNLVQPGSTDTEMNPADGPTADQERALAALGRYGSTAEIAATVAHLAGEGGAFTTGAVFTVDGGMAA
jgi:NAD(P)-dependent dehydrogenase (short-subunit alcohol dehydrogenase family)